MTSFFAERWQKKIQAKNPSVNEIANLTKGQYIKTKDVFKISIDLYTEILPKN